MPYTGRGSHHVLRQFARGRHQATFSFRNNKFSLTKKDQSGGGKRKYVPRKAAVKLTRRARIYFKRLLEDNPEKAGIMLHYKQASSGQPRMVFSFGFVTIDDMESDDEGVSLEVDANGDPLAPGEALEDGKPKLYINAGAFLKVLGATVDIDLESVTPILYDREGNRMDPNA
ncbi:unnamed protein product [Cylindrotheca closterium]|uniref:Uncharacterized protein n=1 Tax=Cylindrotheca closterium TaxID=2856 RepID=A0AAD2FYT5_9STRA|nr:unnamed protein product [Cylindrotheca closterium]